MDRMNRKTLVLALLAIIMALVLLRIFNVGHVLGYDEAWNVNSVIDAKTGHTADVFYSNFLRHPPLYTGLGVLYASITGAGKMGVSKAMEIISIIGAAALAVIIFFCGRDWFGDLAGLSAAFLFAVMPAARVYDTLVKQESTTLLLGMLFVLFFFRKRYVVSGVFLGFAMLTKEIFIFAPAAVLLFLLATRRYKEIKGFFASLGIGVAMSFWWYLFVSRSKGEFLRFFLGRSLEAANWRQPWYYFLHGIPADVGWVMVVIVLAGVVFFALRVRKEGWPGWSERSGEAGRSGASADERDERRTWQMALLPLIWILFVYAFLSLSLGKPPWLTYSALPAFAVLGGWSVSEGYRLMSTRPVFAKAAVAIVLAAALALSLPVGFGSFLKRADPTYRYSLNYERVADYMNHRMSADGKVMLRVNDFSPNLAFYLKSYQPESVFLLGDKTSQEGGIPESRSTVYIFERDEDLETVADQIRSLKPDFVMIRPGFRLADGTDIAAALAEFSRPVEFDGVWVFDGQAISDALGRT
jgi:Dolichyl-phosphate-mannose-protein mannosyltransferase